MRILLLVLGLEAHEGAVPALYLFVSIEVVLAGGLLQHLEALADGRGDPLLLNLLHKSTNLPLSLHLQLRLLIYPLNLIH